MPVMKGLLAPQNTFLDNIANRFDGTPLSFHQRQAFLRPWAERGGGPKSGETLSVSPDTALLQKNFRGSFWHNTVQCEAVGKPDTVPLVYSGDCGLLFQY
ncbi:UNVERIFIED_CONTAM: hypothetical protein K2H54_018547 [Gekko kuhli]